MKTVLTVVIVVIAVNIAWFVIKVLGHVTMNVRFAGETKRRQHDLDHCLRH